MEARRRGGSFHVDSSDDNNVIGAGNSDVESRQAIRSHNIEVNVENDDTDSSDNSKDGNLAVIETGFKSH